MSCKLEYTTIRPLINPYLCRYRTPEKETLSIKIQKRHPSAMAPKHALIGQRAPDLELPCIPNGELYRLPVGQKVNPELRLPFRTGPQN
jgi:hypothetical protein